MPYELSLILRQMSRPEMISALKRTTKSILDNGGVVRKLNNLGTSALAHKISKHGLIHKEGTTQFIITFDVAPTKLVDLTEEFGRDIDIVRRHIFKADKPEEDYICTLPEEMLPPAYREDLKKLMEKPLRRKNHKKDFKYNTGLDYYPFQK